MNFFEQQDRARRNTGRLVLLMTLAVVSLVALATIALIVALQFADMHVRPGPELVMYVAAVVIGVVLLGGLYKQAQLGGGGARVAERLGGRLVNLEAKSPEERRLLNVVEEMAIASGTPVPPVYLLDDDAINAFAAGLTPQNAVIGITRGAVQALSREELQGVIAHEFSHIFNGDMRLNIRLVAILHGILLIGLIGEAIVRSLGHSSSSRSNRSSERNGNAGLALVLAGVALVVLGYAGTFFGNLIKAAVSRQREFLADASAVQFTRNPDSIAGALKKIGATVAGSQLRDRHAAEFSHLFFGAGTRQSLSGMMATHPPLEERIRRIEPGWDGTFPAFRAAHLAPENAAADTRMQQALGVAVAMSAAVYNPVAMDRSISAIGDPQATHLQYARQALDSLPASLKSAAHSTIGAQALVLGLLLQREPELLATQLELLRPEIEPALFGVLGSLRGELLRLEPGQRLPLLDLAIPALKQLPAAEVARLKANLLLLIRADGQVELLEWTLLRIVERNIEPPRRHTAKYHLLELADDVALLLGALARAGHGDTQQCREAFIAASAQLPFESLPLRQGEGVKGLDLALDRLAGLQPLQKPQLLQAMAVCVTHDGRIGAAEAELVRAVADTIGCPMPPLLAA
ncbi:M48 family metallopeptidase [Pseudomonas sp. LRF_L74]|uniref:M48 family metallopeptidase n=1 Tax=Pseudomonas sp. LRF_L74 TaxID=3369422 RepID=UPI003F60A118